MTVPAGGSFVAGFEQRLGFKALDAQGSGVDVKGKIVDDGGMEVCTFASGHGRGVADAGGGQALHGGAGRWLGICIARR